MQNIVVFGASGFAKGVIDIIEKAGQYAIAGLVDTRNVVGTSVFGYPVVGTDADLPHLMKTLGVSIGAIAIGDNWTRYRVARRLRDLAPALGFPCLIHPSAQLARGAQIGSGTIVSSGAVVNADATIGEFVLLMTHASVGHDGCIGDFATLAARAAAAGGARIGAFSMLGMGVSVIREVVVGEHTVIGAGSTVIRNIGDRVVACGYPARVVRSREPGDAYL